jgi:light-regulated signal transduction histidine kinase (bacteriophytochrome)
MHSIADAAELDSLRQALTRWVSAVTGFERVMYYQFLEGGDGEVVAETCLVETQGSYLGLRFPASDIPLIARRLYLQNPWRVIADAGSEPLSLQGSDKQDLTWCDLRSVSPVHAIYMQNMGDRASFSIPVISGQELDALLSCHSPEPGVLPLARLRAVQEVVRRYNTLLRDFRSRSRVRLLDEMTRTIQTELRQQAGLDASDSWQHLSRWLLQEFEADALIWCRNGEQRCAGISVEPELVQQLDSSFLRQTQELVFVADSIRQSLSIDLLSTMAGAAGVRFRRAGDSEQGRLYLLRTEQVEEVSWGGNPDKPVEHHDGVLGIAPRRSFAKWVETRLGYSRPWNSATRLKLLRLRDELQRSEYALPGDRVAEAGQ